MVEVEAKEGRGGGEAQYSGGEGGVEIFLPDVGRIAVLPYSSAGGRCFVCFVLDPVSVHGPKTKHTKHLLQTDERQCGG